MRFIQPDSIIPDLASPQSLNRYSYVTNRPINFNDPTGHKACEDVDKRGNCTGDKMARFIDYIHKDILNDKGKIKTTAREAATLVMKKAALIYGSDWQGFMDATTFAFDGVSWSHSATMWDAHNNNSDFHGYFTEDYLQEGDSGFHPEFKDGANQIYHFWAGFATAFNPEPYPLRGDASDQQTAIFNIRGLVMAGLGNIWHDNPVLSYVGKAGVSAEDYALTLAAMDIAATADPKSPMDLVGIIDNRLGPNGGSNGFMQNWGWLWASAEKK